MEHGIVHILKLIMEKKDLIQLLNDIFIQIGFKRKGNNWVLTEKDIAKIINLQKSQYNDSYYINYSYNINRLPLGNFRSHVDSRLISSKREEQEFITNLLDLESPISDLERAIELKKFIGEKIVSEMSVVHDENYVLRILNSRGYLYGIPPVVIKHFNLTSPQ